MCEIMCDCYFRVLFANIIIEPPITNYTNNCTLANAEEQIVVKLTFFYSLKSKNYSETVILSETTKSNKSHETNNTRTFNGYKIF